MNYNAEVKSEKLYRTAEGTKSFTDGTKTKTKTAKGSERVYPIG